VVGRGSTWERDVAKLPSVAASARSANRALLKRLKRKPPSDLDATVHALHDEAFSHIDCLTCANCCKTTSPRVLRKDVDRLAKALRLRPAQLIEQYLHEDEDGDLVLNESPCPFLGPDNHCLVYDARPRACRWFPGTDDRRVSRHASVTLENTAVCPAVAGIVERLHSIYE